MDLLEQAQALQNEIERSVTKHQLVAAQQHRETKRAIQKASQSVAALERSAESLQAGRRGALTRTP